MKELKDTVKLMTSLNYKDRFKAEYYQLETRLNKLNNMIERYKADKLDFKPNCSLEILQEQSKAMDDYLTLLKVRAELEGIILYV